MDNGDGWPHPSQTEPTRLIRVLPGGAGAIVTRGSVEHFLGVTAAGAGDTRAAARHLRAAIEANRAAGMPPQVADSSCHLAELLVSIRSDELGQTHKEARGHATEAKAIADRLGMPFVAARAGAVLSHSR